MEDQIWYVIGIAYLLISVIISSVCSKRGHAFSSVFLVCVVCTPLIGAVIYTTYNRPEFDKEEQETTD